MILSAARAGGLPTWLTDDGGPMFLVLKFLFYMEALTFIGLFAFRYCLAGETRKLIDTKSIALAALLPAAACLIHFPILLYALLVAVTAFASRKRSDVASTWVFLLPLLPTLTSPILLGSTYILSVSTILALNLGGWIGILIARREPSIRMFDTIVPAVILTILFIYVDGRDINATSFLRVATNAALLNLLPALIVAGGVANPAALSKFLARLLAAASICSTVAVFEALRSWPLYQSLYPFLNIPSPAISASLNVRAGFLRAPGPFSDPSSMGVFLAAALCVALAQGRSFRQGRHAYVVGLIGLGLLATQSRGAILAAIAGICVIQIYRRRSGVAVPLIIGVAIAKEALDFLAPQSGKLAEILGKSGQAAATADYRLDLLHRGVEEVARHPIVGETPAMIVEHLADLTQGQHIVDMVNGHLFIALAAGLVGLAIWLLVWLIPLVRAFVVRPRRPRPRFLALDAMPGILVSTFIAITFTSIIDRNLIWPIIAFGLLKPATLFARTAQTDASERSSNGSQSPSVAFRPREQIA